MNMNQIMPLLTLYSEIIACLVAAAVISLYVGWMLHRSKARKQLQELRESWEKRYNALDESAKADAENLEEQLQGIANEAKNLQKTNQLLTESLKKNDSSIQKARAESIELNRQHAETQERLQRIIQQKDREILELGNRLNQSAPRQDSTSRINKPASRGRLQQLGLADSRDLTNADTVAINSVEAFDATVQMASHEFLQKPGRAGTSRPADSDTLDSTADIRDAVIVAEQVEESTIALDDEALAFVRRSAKSRTQD